MIRHSQHALMNGALELFSMSVNLILIISFLTTDWHDKEGLHRKSFLTMLISSAVMQLGDGLCYIMMQSEGTAFYRACQITSFVSFFLFMFQYYLYLYTYIRQRDRIHPSALYLCGFLSIFGALFWVRSAFSGQILSFQGDFYVRGPLYWYGQMTGGLILLLAILTFARHRRAVPVKDLLIFAAYLVLPVCGAFLHYIVPEIMLLYPSVTLALVIVYVMMNTRDESELRSRAEEDRQRILISRMQPDILLTSIADIRRTLRTDREVARQSVDVFSSYLRENVDALSRDTLVKMNGEIAHLKNFLFLAVRHYGDRLKVCYEIGPSGFSIPASVLQALAEDVVLYVMDKRPEGSQAVITVRTSEPEGKNCYDVELAWTYEPEPDQFEAEDPGGIYSHQACSNLQKIRDTLSKADDAELTAESGRIVISLRRRA